MSSRLSSRLPAAAGSLLLAAQAGLPAHAAQPTQLAPIAVIGSRAPQPLDDVLGDVTVVDRAAIDRAGSSSLAELLSRQHGIEYVDNGGPQTATSLFMRGANNAQTLILVDGMRINNATAGGGALNAIALNDIERVEILRGAASSLYGADAVGGVINVITRQGADKPLSLRADIGAGSHGTVRTSTSLAGSNAGWRYALNAGYGQSRGYNATTPENAFSYNPDRDSWYQRNVSGSLAYAWATGHEVSIRMFHDRVNGGYDASTAEYNDRAVQTVEGFALASRDRITAQWLSTLRLGVTEDENVSITLGDDSRFRTRQRQYGWQNDYQLTDTQRVTLAFDRLEQRVTGDLQDWSTGVGMPADYAVTARNTNAVTGVYTGDFGRHHVQASLRHDDDSQYGGQTTGGAAYGLDLLPGLRATLAANTAFRAPTFNELYYPGGGNPDLAPEKSRNVEAGLRWQRGSTELGATVYRNRVTNLITGWPSENVGRAILRGVTLTGAHQWGNTALRASLDLQDPHDAATGDVLLRRAKRVFRLNADHRIGLARVGAEWYLSGERYDVGRQRLGGYGLLALTASYDVTPETQVQLRWNNVFDKQYTLAQGYATQGSSVFVNVAYRPR
ncbi:TonB-dependent receptor [Achromobacter sp. GG226]|uniref:TonB-dependent receptor domain-containing protein n=1 Tax=Verticiella alkaliphila TaxID=2779529 RepID=UPI001C0C93D9|nr:TonB-dependent receptor [Verticiella sp. GG226]MBU4612403.1 TonB-dependent receptor [Verticiella sp. GG226]